MGKTLYVTGLIMVLMGLMLLYTFNIQVEYSSQVIDIPVYTITTIPPGTYTATKAGDLHQLLAGETIELEANQIFTKTVNITELEVWAWNNTNTNCSITSNINLRIEGEGSKEVHITIKQGGSNKWEILLDENLSPKENVFSKEYLLRLLDPGEYPLLEIQVKALAKTRLNLLEVFIPYTCTTTYTIDQLTTSITSTTSQYYISQVSSIRFDNLYIALGTAIIGLALMIEGARRMR